MLSDSLFISLSQYLKNPFKSVSARKSNLKNCTKASTKDSEQIPKNQISVAAFLTALSHIS